MGNPNKSLSQSHLWRYIILIFVTVGSRKYQFNRLFKKIDELIELNIIKEEVFAQIGNSDYEPKNFPYERFLDKKTFENFIVKANFIISHGASGTIMNALYHKKKVITVTRLSKFNEHIDDHQIQNNIAFAQKKLVLAVIELDELDHAITKLYKNKDELIEWNGDKGFRLFSILDKFIDENF